MKKAVKIILILSIIGLVVYLIMKRKAKASGVIVPSYSGYGSSSGGSSSTYDTKPLDFNKQLNIGSKGAEVEALQIILVKAFGKNISIDGDFGQQTSSAVSPYDPLPVSLAALWANYIQQFWPRPASLTLAEIKQVYL